MRVRDFSHTGLTVSDFNKAVKFYWEVFGCPLIGVSDAPPARVTGIDVPLPYAANLEKLALPQPEWIVDAARKLVKEAETAIKRLERRRDELNAELTAGAADHVAAEQNIHRLL